jgi:hypothetical protein
MAECRKCPNSINILNEDHVYFLLLVRKSKEPLSYFFHKDHFLSLLKKDRSLYKEFKKQEREYEKHRPR